ncbi:TolC family protein [Halpernia frigidisoli]|uniref:Outer membrane protein TolC n=1 Tax=Halpernia frigidisoli TaxID=1125876 RepID=A0A1I3HNK8_9FLAO|nr:TolC family protein [Halpernia frigidisoli]SFI37179.1 Outer membrane protein TolC [Halpernia frigidisoli]
MRRKNKIVFAFLLLVSSLFQAQDSLLMSKNEFLNIVKNYHPLLKKYQLQNKIAQAEITKARGNFDPVLSAKTAQKNIDNALYYDQKNIELGIPTWYGVEINGAYNYLTGDKLNPSETKGGLYNYGLTVPLAKNLLYDKRRAALEQAKAAEKMTRAEQIILSNELLLEAENSYWEWVKNYEVLKIQKKNVTLNKKRFALIKKTFSYGEIAAIDTVEAESQLQNFQIQEKDASLNFIKSTQDLQVFLWQDNLEFYQIKVPIFPSEKMNLEFTDDYLFLAQKLSKDNLVNSQFLKYYAFKNNILESERKLKWQSFLPKIDFTYQFYNKQNENPQYLPFFEDNFQYGLKLEIPIFLRGARADYQMAKIKLLQNEQDIKLKENELLVKTQTYEQEVENYNSQIFLAERNLKNFQLLLKAEETKFENGESSIFLINSRENKAIESQEKLINLKSKVIKSYIKLKWLSENLE